MNNRTKKQLNEEWEELLKRHSKPLEKGAKAKGVKLNNLVPQKEKLLRIDIPKIKSLVTPGGNTSKIPNKMYTGNNILGVAVLHKSCLQPIFNKEAAIETAQMRRG